MDEIVINAVSKKLKDPTSRGNLNNSKFWSSDFTQPELGTCHTFHHPLSEADITVSRAPQFFFTLIASISHNIFIHDPKFFMLMVNPYTIPQIENVVGKPGKNAVLKWQYISTTKHIKKNLASHVCNEDPDYNFLDCVKNSLAKTIGCKPEWQNESDMPHCVTMEQMKKILRLF